MIYSELRFVKSTQPGIEASESKVKFYALCESLKFRREEIIVRFYASTRYRAETKNYFSSRTWTSIMRIGRSLIQGPLHEGRGQKTGVVGLILRSDFWIIMVRHLAYGFLMAILLIIAQF